MCITQKGLNVYDYRNSYRYRYSIKFIYIFNRYASVYDTNDCRQVVGGSLDLQCSASLLLLLLFLLLLLLLRLLSILKMLTNIKNYELISLVY